MAQTPDLSVIDWGKNAFGDGEELVKFFRMHGHEICGVTEQPLLEEARQAGVSMPHFPREGSIVDKGAYIIVNF